MWICGYVRMRIYSHVPHMWLLARNIDTVRDLLPKNKCEYERGWVSPGRRAAGDSLGLPVFHELHFGN